MKDKINLEFGTALREHRLLKGVKRHELAIQIGVDPDTIGNYERGQTGPTLATAMRIAELLDFDLVDVFEGDAA